MDLKRSIKIRSLLIPWARTLAVVPASAGTFHARGALSAVTWYGQIHWHGLFGRLASEQNWRSLHPHRSIQIRMTRAAKSQRASRFPQRSFQRQWKAESWPKVPSTKLGCCRIRAVDGLEALEVRHRSTLRLRRQGCAGAGLWVIEMSSFRDNNRSTRASIRAAALPSPQRLQIVLFGFVWRSG